MLQIQGDPPMKNLSHVTYGEHGDWDCFAIVQFWKSPSLSTQACGGKIPRGCSRLSPVVFWESHLLCLPPGSYFNHVLGPVIFSLNVADDL